MPKDSSHPRSPAETAWRHFGVLVAGLGAAFAVPLWHWGRLALGHDLHSHVLLVPLVTGYLVWIERHAAPAPVGGSPVGTAVWALAAVGIVAASWWPGVTDDLRLSLRILALLVGVIGVGWHVLGPAILRHGRFAFAFLLFAVPLPEAAVTALETALKYASAEVANLLFTATDVPMLRDGLYFRLPGLTIQVAQECSGIRSTVVLCIVGVIAAKLFLTTGWKRAVLVLVVIPLGIARNAFRIWLLAYLTVNVNPDIIHSWLHHRGGPVFFVLSLVPFFALLWWLTRSERRASAVARRVCLVAQPSEHP